MTEETFCSQDGSDLKELFNSQIQQVNVLINANDKNYNQRFDNVIEATKNALAASDRAVTKAESASEKRFDAVNEFRATLADQQRNLMPRGEVEILIKAINEKIDSLNITTISRQSKDTGTREGIGTVALVAGLISTLIVIISRFIK